MSRGWRDLGRLEMGFVERGFLAGVGSLLCGDLYCIVIILGEKSRGSSYRGLVRAETLPVFTDAAALIAASHGSRLQH